MTVAARTRKAVMASKTVLISSFMMTSVRRAGPQDSSQPSGMPIVHPTAAWTTFSAANARRMSRARAPTVREALHPAIHRDVVDLDPAFGQELFDVAVGQAVAQVPAQRHGDHLSGKPITDRRG
jgi:hypothetical protein